MIGAVARKLFGSANDRRIRAFRPRVDEINALEKELEQLSDEALRARTDQFKKQLAEGATLDDILIPAFATVREAGKRTLGQRHFDVQMIGGMVLHEGRISEMKTGEGKTLVATLPVYLNALAGRGVHVVTVNDYLAKRDAEWMGQIYSFLGLSVGVIVHGLDDEQRKKAYDCDVTYGTNNELGFDYLRDNMKYRLEDMVQRGHIYAIVDEVDSILIDEARTPLIISGPLDDRSDFYKTIDAYIERLDAADYEIDEKQRTVNLTEIGMEKMEQVLRADNLLKGNSLYDVENVSTVHHVNQALRAHKLFTYGKDYTRKRGEVIIIDEFTGRMMPGRRYSEGLHQALEAKEARIVEAKITKRADLQSPANAENHPSQLGVAAAPAPAKAAAAKQQRDVIQSDGVAGTNDDAWRMRLEEEIKVNARDKVGKLFRTIVEAETEDRWDAIKPDQKVRWEKIKAQTGDATGESGRDANQLLRTIAVAAACGVVVCAALVAVLVISGVSIEVRYGAGIVALSLLAAIGISRLMTSLRSNQTERLIKKVKKAWETNQWRNIAPEHRRLWEQVRADSDSDKIFKQIIEADLRGEWDSIPTHYRKLWAGIKSQSQFDALNRAGDQFDQISVAPKFKELWIQLESEADSEARSMVEQIVHAQHNKQSKNLPAEQKKLLEKSKANVERDIKEVTIRETKRVEEDDDLEPVAIQAENQTLASITFQNYFRMYEKLAGMTGTAVTEADEFADIYKLDVIEVPTNMPMIRLDDDDEVYRTRREKLNAIANSILDCSRRGQPVLAGTTSIEHSKELSDVLNKKGIHHQVLNARYHDIEAAIIAEAGRRGAVTIATNMAGRGTDIQLGGNPEVRFQTRLRGQVPDEDIAKVSAEVIALDHAELGRVTALFKHIVKAAAANEWADFEPRYKSLWEGVKTVKAAVTPALVPGDKVDSDANVEGRGRLAQVNRSHASQIIWASLFAALTAAVFGIGYAVKAEVPITLIAVVAVNLITYFVASRLVERTIARFWPSNVSGVIEVKEAANFGTMSAAEAEAESERITKRILEAKERDRLENVELRYRELWQKVTAEIEAERFSDSDKSPFVEPAQIKLWTETKEEVRRDKRRVIEAGGLYVLGTERHESRRIDNQLRGRSGRQGDPGHSKFFLSLEDDLMRIFGTDKLDGMLTKLGLKEDEAIIHPWINKALEKAQQKVEARNFDIRKNILKFDNVMNDQRKVIFDQRVEWMDEKVVAEVVGDMRHTVIDDLVAKHVPENAYPEQWDTPGLKEELKRVLNLDLPVDEWAKEEGIADEEIFARVERRADEHMASKVAQWGTDVIRYVEKSVLLQSLDHLWREHLVMLDHLRQVIGLRGYGQRDPLNEYKAEAFNLFEAMSQSLREAVTAQLMRVEIQAAPPPEQQPAPLPMMVGHKADPITGEDEMALATAGAETLARHGIGPGAGPAARAPQTPARNPKDPTSWGKVGRNETCPCGSGKKFKHCHGRYA